MAHWVDSGKPERVVGFLLRSLHLTLRHSMDEALRLEGVELSFAHFAALFGLRFEPGATGAQLARRALVSAQTMNSILRKLEAEGLVTRVPHPATRRADSWNLTPSGLRELERAAAVGDAVFARMLGALEPSEIELLQTCLSRCIAALGSEDRILERILAERTRPQGALHRERA